MRFSVILLAAVGLWGQVPSPIAPWRGVGAVTPWVGVDGGVHHLREEIDKASMFEEIVGTSRPLKAVLSRIAKVAPTDSTTRLNLFRRPAQQSVGAVATTSTHNRPSVNVSVLSSDAF
jgi:hypothetical protein